MTRATIGGCALAAVLVLVALVLVLHLAADRASDPASVSPTVGPPPATVVAEPHPQSESHEGLLYGRITTRDGTLYEGRLRWGGGEEAFWGDAFNGTKKENPWADHVAPERLTRRRPIKIFGRTITERERPIDLERPFMVRFGDIARIEVQGREIRVTLKNGTVFNLDLFSADDLGDGVRVWDAKRGVVDLGERQIRAIELLPNPSPGEGPYRLHGTVRTRQDTFTGFIQWNREKGVGTDVLIGRTAERELGLRFDAIRSITNRPLGGTVVTLLDDREVVVIDGPDVGESNRGIYVDDPRYGRVLISWDAFERADFSPGGSGPAYDAFPPSSPLTGSVTSRTGTRFSGRLVFDLDESETVETLDAPSQGVNYSIPFGLIAAIVPPGRDQHARVVLHNGEELWLEPAGDLGEQNAGVLIFADGRPNPGYVPWLEVERIDLDR